MKKLLLFAWLAGCQYAATAQVSILPKFGLTLANASLDDDNAFHNDTKLSRGFTGGLGINYPLTSDGFLSLQPEFLYTQKGFGAESSNTLSRYDGRYIFNYLEMPLLLKIGFGSDKLKAYVNAGPSVGYLLSGKVKGNWNLVGFGGDVNESLQFTDNPTPGDLSQLDANRVEVGVNFGGGIGYGIGENVLFADLRYTAGLTDFDNRQQSKNRVFGITFGVQLPIQ